MERYRTTIILVVVLVVLAGVAYFLNSNRTSGGTETTATPTPDVSKLVWQETEPVDSIDVVSGTRVISLRKDVTSTIWTITQPIKSDADPYSVGSVADSLKSLQALAVITSPTNLSQYGLEKPAWQVLVRAKTAKHTLRIGGTTIDGAGYYVKDGDNPKVFVVANTTIEPMKSWLDNPPKAQPSPTPLPLTVAPTNTITPTGTLTVTLPVSGTSSITSTSPITATGPGAANPTTPVASPTAP